MFIGRVLGNLVATQKAPAMVGRTLLVVEPYRVDEASRDRLAPTGRTFVAVDALGAGVGAMVLVCQGANARRTPETESLPVDAVIIGLVDAVDVDGKLIYSSRSDAPAGEPETAPQARSSGPASAGPFDNG